MARGKELPRDCVQLGRVQLLLDGRLDSSEQRAFESHLADCPACRAELRSMEEVRARLQRAAAAPLPAWDRAEVASRLPGGQASPGAHGMRIAWLWAPALGAAGLAGLLFWLWPSRPAPYVTAPERRIEIPAGERELLVSRASGESALGAVRRERGRWTLDRGAEIDLRPEDELGLRLGRDIFLVFDRGARLSVEQDGDGAWSVALDRGRAVARLRPGRRVPFCILAPAGRIEALGTAFEVEVQNGATELRLAEGRLALSMRWGQRFSLAAPIRVLARPGADLELGLAEPSPPGPLSLGERGDRSRLGEGVSRLGEGEPSKRLGEGEPSKRLGEGEPSKRLGEGETSKRLGEGETSKRLGEGEPSKRLDGEEPAGRQGGEEPAGRQGGEEPAGRQGG
ncbi:MAG: zf-HC2 domain-containing protein, partial [Deltaproteobacteria bacterium]|nr:zf-HC2 domain-containing protein [Deltaproteobacteria bacterium]